MTAPAAFSIVPFEGDFNTLPEPTAGPYIVAAKDGYYVHRKFHFGRVIVPVKESPMTPALEPVMWAEIEPRLPAALVGQAYSFFRAIYDARHSEAMVDITWTPESGYRLFVPPQVASHGGVKATRVPEHYHGQIVGTIHSHCDFSAFHSGTDKHDAEGHDGLHITIGDVKKPQPSVAAMLSVAKVNWDVEIADVIDGPLVAVNHPKWWERYVGDPVKPEPTQISYGGAPWRPQGAPNKNTPVVIAGAKQTTYQGSLLSADSLDELEWRFNDAFSAVEHDTIQEAASILDAVQIALNKIGIEMNTEFTIDPFSEAALLADAQNDDDAFNDRIRSLQ